MLSVRLAVTLGTPTAVAVDHYWIRPRRTCGGILEANLEIVAGRGVVAPVPLPGSVLVSSPTGNLQAKAMTTAARETSRSA